MKHTSRKEESQSEKYGFFFDGIIVLEMKFIKNLPFLVLPTTPQSLLPSQLVNALIIL